MSGIAFTPEEMHQRANEYRAQASSIGDTTATLTVAFDQLVEGWQGSASIAHQVRFNEELKPGLLRVQEFIESVAAELDNYANDMSGLDNQYASKGM